MCMRVYMYGGEGAAWMNEGWVVMAHVGLL